MLWLYTFATDRWMQLFSENPALYWPEWSHDSKYVYVSQGDDDILRIDILSRKVEVALHMKDIPRTGFWGNSFTLTPDDKILLLRNTGSEDLYAFDPIENFRQHHLISPSSPTSMEKTHLSMGNWRNNDFSPAIDLRICQTQPARLAKKKRPLRTKGL